MLPKYLFLTIAGSFVSALVLIQLFTTENNIIPIAFSDDVKLPSRSLQVGWIIFATGKYIQFAELFIKSMRRYFDCPICNVTYVIFTDSDLSHRSSGAKDIELIPYQLIGWPYDTLKRVHAFKASKTKLSRFDYLLAIDADMRARGRVGMEILGDRVATLHPAFYHNKFRGTFENSTHSSAYIDPSEGSHYFAGGFYGGRSAEFWQLCEGVADLIDVDLAHGYIAIWHDESYLNRYLATYPPSVILSPAYCYPDLWKLPYEKKIVARTKRHEIARS